MATEKADHWTLDKRVPLAIIITVLAQTAGAVWWAASLNERVGQLERALIQAAGQDGRIVRVETKLEGLGVTLDKIDAKVDRLIQQGDTN